jgi:alpha-beta hydrolase superfamily lysophospholipase
VRARNKGGRIALLGYSSGAVAALYAAARSPEISAVIADSAFSDAEDVLRREAVFLRHPPPNAVVPWGHRTRLMFFTNPVLSPVVDWVFRLRTGVRFRVPEDELVNAVGKISRPHVLYLAAERDPVVPREVTERLYRATASPHKQLLIQPGAFHSAMAGDVQHYMAAVAAFLDDAFGTEPAPTPKPQSR